MKLEKAERRIYEWQGRQFQGRGAEDSLAKHRRSARWYAERLRKYLPSDKSARILDLPCGDGNILYFLKEEGFNNAEGWDIAEGRVVIATSLGLNASVRDAFEALPKEKNLSVIFSIDFLDHIDKAEAINFLESCNDALVPGGTLIIRTPVTDSVFGGLHLYNDFTHRWATNTGVWRAIAGITGFKVDAFFDERPIPTNLKRLVGRGLFEAAKFAGSLFYNMLGQSRPEIWSPSAWLILKKV